LPRGDNVTTKCPKCDYENPDTQRFCGDCGTQLTLTEDITAVTKTLETPAQELTRGTVFANRYEIIEELGTGGMGKVYRVYDKKIEGEVALKLIKSEVAADKKTIERFRNELKLAREIAHRNVCHMYDLNEDKGSYYITMEYVSGENLKSLIRRMGKIPTEKAISIIKQISEGLSEAHTLEVVHRDLKPSNIMVDKNGNVRIMDFGIARSLDKKGITVTGVVIGTPDYMSPEQAEAKAVDQRSDIYSLGVILYEMMTGRVPFEGDTAISIAMKHKSEVPKDPKEYNTQIPDDLSQLILKCLEKDKENRYQSAEELISELERVEQGLPTTARVLSKQKLDKTREKTISLKLRKLVFPFLIVVAIAIIALILWQLSYQREPVHLSAEKPSIAVIPFADLSSQKDQEYFCDGITEEIIARLSRIEGWKVISRTSVLQYKHTDKDIRVIGQELDVAIILEGSIRKEEEDIRITAQLINTEDGFHVWSEIYDRKVDKVFDIQSEISEKITEALNIKLSPKEKDILRKRPTEDLEAYNLYLRGRYFWNERTEEGLKRSINYFQQAIEIDESFALAHVGIADAYNNLGSYDFIPPQEAHPKAKKSALRALEIDEEIAEAYASLGFVNMRYDWDWPGAERNFKKAIRLKPSYATAHSWYGAFLRSMGRFDEAIEELKQAQNLDPLSLPIMTTLGSAYYFSRQTELAIQQCKKVLEIDASFHWAHNILGNSYLQKSLFKEAISEFESAIDLSGGTSWYLADLAHGYAVSGDIDEALRILKELQEKSKLGYIPQYEIAIVKFAVGEKDEAFLILEELYNVRSGSLMHIRVDPRFDSVRSDPRFNVLLEKMDLD
jgi:serine/threonine protein kinase/Flp pilus assembly protein TadD